MLNDVWSAEKEEEQKRLHRDLPSKTCVAYGLGTETTAQFGTRDGASSDAPAIAWHLHTLQQGHLRDELMLRLEASMTI